MYEIGDDVWVSSPIIDDSKLYRWEAKVLFVDENGEKVHVRYSSGKKETASFQRVQLMHDGSNIRRNTRSTYRKRTSEDTSAKFLNEMNECIDTDAFVVERRPKRKRNTAKTSRPNMNKDELKNVNNKTSRVFGLVENLEPRYSVKSTIQINKHHYSSRRKEKESATNTNIVTCNNTENEDILGMDILVEENNPVTVSSDSQFAEYDNEDDFEESNYDECNIEESLFINIENGIRLDEIRSQEQQISHSSLMINEVLEREIRQNSPFLTYTCKCEEKRQQYRQENPYEYCTSCGNAYKKCCLYKLEWQLDDNWECPSCEGISMSPPPQKKEYLSKEKLQKAVEWANQESRTEYNRSQVEAPESSIYSSEKYSTQALIYRNIVNDISSGKQAKRKPLTVLSVFSGIGSDILVLKRLGISIGTMIFVEHDRVAMHVIKHNHDCTYNKNLPIDGIKYMYIDNYDDIDEEKILREVGPIDLIVGGPPCQDHSQMNAYRKGLEGESGKYTILFAEMIQRIQKHHFQQHKHLFFLVENVLVHNKEDAARIDAAYRVPPVHLDAQRFSPCKRSRSYWTNLPVAYFGEPSLAMEINDNACPQPENNFLHPAQCLSPGQIVKANCFCASYKRIDDYRMNTARKESRSGTDSYLMSKYSTKDRELMMGFPPGYIEDAVHHLWQTLIKDAFKVNDLHSGVEWKKTLEKKFHHFSECEFTFKKSTLDDKSVTNVLQISSELEQKEKPYRFNFDQYGKHLIGNSWSIPVVEELLSPLKDICEERQYENYNYRFYWRLVLE